VSVYFQKKQNSEELRELSGLDPVSLVIKKGRLRWFGLVECKDDADWITCCTALETDGVRQKVGQERHDGKLL